MEKQTQNENPRGLEAICHGSSILSETARLLKLLSEQSLEAEAIKKMRFGSEQGR